VSLRVLRGDDATGDRALRQHFGWCFSSHSKFPLRIELAQLHCAFWVEQNESSDLEWSSS
jgi:hypothetical protein